MPLVMMLYMSIWLFNQMLSLTKITLVQITTPVPTTTPVSFCEDEPAQDENAIESCSWILDTDSPFHVNISILPSSQFKNV